MNAIAKYGFWLPIALLAVPLDYWLWNACVRTSVQAPVTFRQSVEDGIEFWRELTA